MVEDRAISAAEAFRRLRFQRTSDIRSTLETLQATVIVSEPRREEPTGSRTLVLRGIQHLDVKNGDVLLLLGTTQGAFLARSRPERLFLQNHWGLYRSDDGADSWNDIAHGLPWDYGFAMATHPHDPDCVFKGPTRPKGPDLFPVQNRSGQVWPLWPRKFSPLGVAVALLSASD